MATKKNALVEALTGAIRRDRNALAMSAEPDTSNVLSLAARQYMPCPETALRCDSKVCITRGCARARHEFKPGPGMSPGICAKCGYPASELLQHFPRAAIKQDGERE